MSHVTGGWVTLSTVCCVHQSDTAGASRIRTFSSRGDDGRNGDSRGDGLDSSSGNQVWCELYGIGPAGLAAFEWAC